MNVTLQVGRPDDRRQTSAISINGAGDNQNNQLIDGVDNNERAIGATTRRSWAEQPVAW